MPATPLHMGPGILVKALAGRYFSLLVFGFAQVMIDIEPVVRIIRGDAFLHGFTHTYLGATGIAIISALIGRPVCQMILDRWRDDPASPFMNWLRGPPRISWTAAISGALLGTYSHVVLDSIMHVDMEPFTPLSTANALHQIVSLDALHIFCLATAVLGATVMVFLYASRSITKTND
jgi:hypothetical protein